MFSFTQTRQRMDATKIYLGIDVGSTSARCAAVTGTGKVISTAIHPIKTWNPHLEFYQQSSDDIWKAVCIVVKDVISRIDRNNVRGLGFDATCSLVALNKKEEPLSISLKKESEQNVILWMDHRAKEESNEINHKKLDCLKFLGGTISPEMQPPKIMWIKKNLPKQWSNLGHLMDLPDFLTWKATGSTSRSLCSVVCKWLYQADENRNCWDDSIWKELNLFELLDEGHASLGDVILVPGQPCGNGLNEKAAEELGLRPGIPVSTSMIDAHAGGIGTLGCSAEGVSKKLTSRLAVISGTSTCHMMMSERSIFVPGVWGPYFSAMVPSYYLNEAGQSAAGSLIDHIINSHPATKDLKLALPPKNHIQQELNDILKRLADKNEVDLCALSNDLHVWPDFHGNRSPLADPTLKGMVMGLTLSSDVEALAKLYLATLQALAYGTRHIIETMRIHGHQIDSMVLCGGLSKNKLYVQIHADVTGVPVVLPQELESVLLGAAILGAAASGDFKSVKEAMNLMAGNGTVIHPKPSDLRYHEKKYKVFLSMLELQRTCQAIMEA